MLPIGLSFPVLFKRVAKLLGVTPLPVPHQLRHAGASADRAQNRRPLAEVKKRGRWASDRSVARYNKENRINQALASLSSKVLNYCE
eukprot:12061932-Karenia_brevis.AAC.1